MKKCFWLILGVLLMYSCEKVEIDAIDNLHEGKVYVIGHAGEGFYSYKNHYPFNSKGSISRALKFHRADGIEVDFQMTRDHKGILYHDDYLDTQTDCSGSVYHYTQKELLNCRYSADIYPALFLNEYLVPIDAAFSLCMEMPDPKPIVFIDIKSNPTGLALNMDSYKDSLARLLSGEIVKYIPSKIHFITSDEDLLNRIREKAPFCNFHIEGKGVQELITVAVENKFDGIVLTEDDMEKADSKTAHKNNLSVTLFGVRSLDDIEDALELDPDYVHTDNIALTQSVLRSL